MVAVVGRQIMKVFGISNGQFTNECNLRTTALRNSKHLNLNYSACNVAWSLLQNHTIATTSTNGSVVIWNLERPSRDKMEKVYTCHSRAATKVCFHRSDPNLLISGSKDARINVYDLRNSEPVRVFTSGTSDSVRDIQLGLHQDQQDMFVVGDDSGQVRFWDLRKEGRPLKQFPSHQGHVASVNFHPSSFAKNLLATGGGRDKFIRVWDWSKPTPEKPIYVVETASSIARVYWRPQHSWHIASCSVINDFAINIWDIRRPFMPRESFEEHKDVATDIAWCEEDPDRFVSTGRDGLLIMHRFDLAQRPLDYANEIAVDVSAAGHVAVAISSLPKRKVAPGSIKSSFGGLFSQQKRVADIFGLPITSQLYACNFTHFKELSSGEFIQLAQRYKLFGMTLSELCDCNAEIAQELQRPQIAQTWRMLKTVLGYGKPYLDSGRPDNKETGERKTSEPEAAGFATTSVGTEGQSDRIGFSCVETLSADQDFPQDEMNSQITKDRSLQRAINGLENDSLQTHSDFFFGRQEMNIHGIDMDQDVSASTELKVQMEVFSPRTVDLSCGLMDQQISNDMSPISIKNRSDLVLKRPAVLNVSSDVVKTVTWDPSPLVSDVLLYYVEMGDIQTVVSILVVLGERSLNMVDLPTQESWFLEYLDLLDRYQLWTVSARIIKQCVWIPNVNVLSQEGTGLTIRCGFCSQMTCVAQKCFSCNRYVSSCIICQNPVRGLWSWCPVCAHGGHMDHMKEWFQKYQYCPTGCGHKCQSFVM